MIRRWLPLLLLILTASIAAPHLARATEVWTGRTFGFAKVPNGNPTLPQNQDRITPLVWITRASTQGIYNIKQESAYAHNVSPKDTQWATGDAVNHASLFFQDWEDWTGANPPATVGVNACVHLVSEDIYIDIVFDSWGGSLSGGSFSYRRALPPAVPNQATSWGRIKQLYK